MVGIHTNHFFLRGLHRSIDGRRAAESQVLSHSLLHMIKQVLRKRFHISHNYSCYFGHGSLKIKQTASFVQYKVKFT